MGIVFGAMYYHYLRFVFALRVMGKSDIGARVEKVKRL